MGLPSGSDGKEAACNAGDPGLMQDTGCLGLVHWDDPEGGGFRMGNTDIPVADSFQYLAKLIQYCKV